MELYAVALYARRGIGVEWQTSISAWWTTAYNRHEALGMAIEKSKETNPPADGWIGHRAQVEEISLDAIKVLYGKSSD